MVDENVGGRRRADTTVQGPAVIPLSSLLARLRADVTEWQTIAVPELLFQHRSAALSAFLVLVGLSIAALLGYSVGARRIGRNRIVLPAILPGTRRFSASWLRHAPTLCALAGMPFFMLALADPLTTVVEQQVSYPGRRIALVIDASSSMLKPFSAGRLNARAPNQAAFFTSVGAADTFIRQRRNGKYKDLIALIEFGDEAYVITPFTTDYDNILLSTSLIGEWSEFMRFPNQGTKIAAAIDQGTTLFKAFNFLHAAGNLMVIFSDGEDAQVRLHDRHVNEIVAGAVSAEIPIFLIRTNRDKRLGDIVPDALWKPAVESTGGRFYAAATEGDVLRAIQDIDTRVTGTIEVKQYGSNVPRYVPFTIMASALWAAGIFLKLAVPWFSTFP
jgi:VWA domain-containing protein